MWGISRLWNLGQRLNPVRQYPLWRYKRMATGVAQLDFPPTQLKAEGYFSQCGQDKWLIESCLPGLRGGVFVDIGAHDGVSFSNTCYLERQMGWTGVAVEPMPEIFARLNENRSCIKVNGCIAAQPGIAKFQQISGYAEMLSGLTAQYDPRHLARIRREVAAHGGQVQEITVQCYQLNALLAEQAITHVDYLNVDVEGAEYAILRSIDWTALDIRVCGIENNYRDYRIPAWMHRHGYTWVATLGDEFYVKRGRHA